MEKKNGSKIKKVLNVKWLRKEEKGKFIWNGFGEK
jgi:GTP-dependent phosphoenolpyruvate carboxykinase